MFYYVARKSLVTRLLLSSLLTNNMIIKSNLLRFDFKLLHPQRVTHSKSTLQSNYELIYSLPYARAGSVVNRLKLFQATLSAFAIPVSYALEIGNIVPEGCTTACTVTSLAFNAALFSLGQLFYRLVGKVYLDEKRKKVKISYVGYFGKRIDIELPMQDVLPLDRAAGLLYSKAKIQNYKSLSFVKIQEKYSEYCNVDLSRRVFGESFMRS